MKLLIKLLLVIFITISISFAIYTFVIINQETQDKEKELRNKINYNEKSYSTSVSVLLYELNSVVLKSLLSSIYKDEEIVRIELKDSSNTISIILDEKYKEDEEIIKNNIKLSFEEEEIGELHIFYTKRLILTHLKEYKENIFLFSVVLVLFLFFSLYIFLKKTTTSLNLLIRATDIISLGNLSEKVNINSNDEIGLLANKFEIMRQSLKSRVEENEKQSKQLSKLNKNLELIVEDRTMQLQRTNEELEDSNEELQTLIFNLKQTQDQLIQSEKMASLGGLVAGVAHEINTPVGISLTGITHFLDITAELQKNYLNEQMSKEEFDEYLETSKILGKQININLERTAHLVKSFKQISVDQTSEEKREFNLEEYIDDVIFSLKSLLKKYKIDVIINVNEEIIITSYPGSYSQIITNLVQNTIKHAYSESKNQIIDIEIIRKNNGIQISFQDYGKGISKINLEKIFNPFFTTNRKNGGTGLGLNIVYNIVTSNLKGEIKCLSEEGKGTTFKINIPIS